MGEGRDFRDKALSCMEDLPHPQKFDMEPENEPLEKVRFHHHLFASMFTFEGCISFGFSRGFFQALGFFLVIL